MQTDPYEMNNLASDHRYQNALVSLRSQLVDQFVTEGRGTDWVKNGVLQRRIAGQVYSPNFPPSGPSPTVQSLISGPPCTWFNTSSAGGYYRNALGPQGLIGPFSNKKLDDVLSWCCSSLECAGFDWDFNSTSGLGSGYYKQNALGGWTDSLTYVGYYKKGQVPGH